MTEIVIDLPAPSPKCGPNLGRSQSRNQFIAFRHYAAYKEQCASVLHADNRIVDIPLPIHRYELWIEWHEGPRADGMYHPHDEDNARYSIKRALDSVKDAGIVAGDSKKNILRSSFTWHTTKAEKGQKRPASFIRYRIRTVEE